MSGFVAKGFARIETDLTDQGSSSRQIFSGALPEESEVNSGGWANWLWKKAVFGFCGVLWLILGFRWLFGSFGLGFTCGSEVPICEKCVD
ncbi:MAG: hypothetical protein ABSA39_16225 [Edaphobacter sp.]